MVLGTLFERPALRIIEKLDPISVRISNNSDGDPGPDFFCGNHHFHAGRLKRGKLAFKIAYVQSPVAISGCPANATRSGSQIGFRVCFDDFHDTVARLEPVHNSAARHAYYRFDFEPQLLAVEGEHGMEVIRDDAKINSRFLNTQLPNVA